MMPFSSFAKKLTAAAVLSLGCAGAYARAHPKQPKTALTPRQQAEHVLDRLSFGPTPGEVEQVQAMGVENWIEQQLHPDQIDDPALNVRLSEFPAMQLQLAQLMQIFPPNPVIRQIADGKLSMPGTVGDPNARVEKAIYSNALAEYRQRQEKKTEKAQAAAPAANSGMTMAAGSPAQALQMDVTTLLTESPADRWNAVLSMEPGTVRPFLQQLRGQRQQLEAGWNPMQKEVLLAMDPQPDRVISSELPQERLIRAAYSQRQLNEVMVNFWLNHFSIYLRKNEEEPWYLTQFERDVIRPHAMGKFEDLLEAVAHSPAMLVYLDQPQSIGPDSVAAERGRKKNAAGLNENYARELMELHTLGVNGGYTQADVIEVAKVFTGWGIHNPQHDAFEFNERRHEPGSKKVLGKTIKENSDGEKEGEKVLHMLAMSPATAHFLSTKLATEFVSDDPPKPLINRMAKTYLKSHGDITAVLETMLKSNEFWSQDAYRAKLKTPFEFVVSSVRATGANVASANGLVASLNQLGMPLWGVQQPNGYSLKADPWLGSESLLARMNFALALTSNRIPGVKVALGPNAAPPAPDTDADAGVEEARLEGVLMDGEVAPHTHDAVLKEMDGATTNMAGTRSVNHAQLAAGLLLGSPDFQRR